MNKYDRILLISGGIGYTFTYPIFKDLVISVFEQRSNCRYIDFVWTIRTLGLCLRVMQRPIFSHFSLPFYSSDVESYEGILSLPGRTACLSEQKPRRGIWGTFSSKIR